MQIDSPVGTSCPLKRQEQSSPALAKPDIDNKDVANITEKMTDIICFERVFM